MATPKAQGKPVKAKQAEEEAPEPTTSDQKILWGRAAGRCSWEECGRELTLTRNAHAQPAVTLGEMAHIVGEKRAASRGEEKLPMADRGKYSNLILLCRHHHITIDRYPAKYTVAVLHKMKDDHERRIDDTLMKTPNIEDLIYADVVDTINQELPLGRNRWHAFTDDAVRMLVPLDLVDARGNLNDKLLTTLWPGKHKSLEDATMTMIKSFSDWISLYEANADCPDNGPMLRPQRGYRHGPVHHVYQGQQDENEWVKACLWLLADFVFKLNAFAEQVRLTINPMYRRRQGRFIVYDDQGMWNGGNPAMMDFNDAQHLAESIETYVLPVRKRFLGH